MKKRTCKALGILLVLLVFAVLPVQALAAVAVENGQEPKLSLSSAVAKVGDLVTLAITMENNPGVIIMALDLQYDQNQLELVNAADAGLLKGGLFADELRLMPYVMHWNDLLSQKDNTQNGIIATLTFRILEDCDQAKVTITQRSRNTFNAAMQDVLFQTEGGTITSQTTGEEPPVLENPFKDVKTTDWFYGAVQFIIGRNLMNGTSADQFSPQKMTNRAMIATILWRMDGSPSVDHDVSFQDVATGKWYTEAIRWAQMNGLVNGYNNNKFGTTDPITREQMAAILYRYAKARGKAVDADDFILEFTDAGKVSTWADQAVRWCVREGFLNGKGSGILDPKGQAKRCEVAAILQRFIEKMNM